MAMHLRQCLLNIIKCPKPGSHLQLVNGFGYELAYRGLSSQPDSEEVDTKTVELSQRKTSGLTDSNPVIVTSTSKKCIVGCNCATDDFTLKWFYLEEGAVQTCNCGYFFKLEKPTESNSESKSCDAMNVDEFQTDLRKGRKGLPFMKPKPAVTKTS